MVFSSVCTKKYLDWRSGSALTSWGDDSASSEPLTEFRGWPPEVEEREGKKKEREGK